MIRGLRELIGQLVGGADEAADETRLDLAVAVLLVEMARADHEQADSERAEIADQLATAFGLDAAAARRLMDEARAAAEQSVSLHAFTRAVHEGMDYPEKLRVVEMLWEVALADSALDRYEDYLIGKVAELLYVTRGDVLRLKHRVVERRSAARP